MVRGLGVDKSWAGERVAERSTKPSFGLALHERIICLFERGAPCV